MVASLNGVTLLKVAPVVWDTKPGIAASRTTVFMDDKSLARAKKNINDSTLQIGARVISNLRILREVSGSGTTGEAVGKGLVLVDRRFVWGRIEYAAFFNVRRRTGEAKISGDGETPLAVRDAIPLLRYLPQTLDGLIPFTLKKCIEKVLKDTKQEPFVIPEEFPDVQVFGAKGFSVQDNVARIITDLLKFAPGWSLTCDDDGTIRFYNKADIEAEIEADNKMVPKLFAQGFTKTSDLRFDRPSKIKVLFFAEAEIRFDYEEDIDRRTAFTTFVEDASPLDTPVDPTLEAVIRAPVPDLQFDSANVMARDSLVRLYLFLNAISTPAGQAIYPLSPNASGQPWDYIAITKYFLRCWDVKDRYVCFGGKFTDKNWDRITRTTLRDFRTHFKLNQDWADRVRDLKPSRVELLDAISLTFRRSPVFADYISKPALRLSSVFKGKGIDLDDLAWVAKESCFNKKTQAFKTINKCERAPADIVSIDNNSKSFRVLYRRSPRGRDEDVMPIGLADEDLPKVINDTNLRIKLEIAQPILQEYQMSTILTCIPQPITGSRSHLHEVEVTPGQAAKVMKIDQGRIGECSGPVWEILIPASPLTTARFFWTDFTTDPTNPDSQSNSMVAPFFSKAAKFPQANLQNKDDVEALAKNAAAAVYFSLLDRLDGKSTAPAVIPPPGIVGGIKSVRTTASPDPKAPIVNVLQFGAEVVPRNPYNNLPAEVRERLLRLIVPGSGD
jgi:hypothetical protein